MSPRPSRFLLRAFAVSALVATLAGIFTLVGATPASAASTTTASATATSPTSIDVTWALGAVAVDRWVVSASTAGKVPAGRQNVCGTCISATFDYLTPGTSYSFVVVGVGPDAPDGVWAGASAATLTDPLCPSGSRCLVVDATGTLGPTTQPGLGLNHGITERTDLTRLTPMKINYHRIAAWNARTFNLARADAGAIDVLLNPAWKDWTTNTYGVAKDPWDDWTTYSWFVRYIVAWHVQNNLVPEYWEIQNEPDQAGWYHGTTTDPTADLVLQQFQVAHDAIRAVLPDAKIVGPSVGAFDDAAQSVISVWRFLQFVLDHGLRIDALAWHELGGDCWGACNAGPRGLAQHVASIRNFIAQHPELGQPEIHINEFGEASSYTEPGPAVGYFAAMTAAGVQRAASACWPVTYDGTTYQTCFNNPGMADGLLMPDGTTPTARWYVWQSYANMTGSVVPSDVSFVDMSAIATRSTDGRIDALVGRHAPGTPTTGESLRVAITTPVTKGSYRVTITTSVPGGSSPMVTDLGTVRVSNGMLDLGSVTIADGAAVHVSATPAAWWMISYADVVMRVRSAFLYREWVRSADVRSAR